MTDDIKTSFLTYYIRSLAERSRVEKASTKYGFDWIIYGLALAEGLIPVRLPFLRGGSNEISKTKTEPEFGIDLSFLSRDRKSLIVFVLKDEVLSNANWKAHDFDPDLRAACTVDLRKPEFKAVSEVKIILAYNKDEDQAGIKHYEQLTQSLPPKIGNQANLSFERWNLTALAEKVKNKLLTPSLLPQSFFSLFSYLCSQFGEFKHGSDQWQGQLVPNWRRFLNDLLQDNADERCIRLLPVALIILREHGGNNPTVETGSIDLAEWAMLAAWQVYRKTSHASTKQAIQDFWVGFYQKQLARFYSAHSAGLAVEHSLDQWNSGSLVNSVATSINSFWHLARLGILALSLWESRDGLDGQRQSEIEKSTKTTADWLVGFLNANPSAKRPLLDVQHIELFLVWRTLRQAGRLKDIGRWLDDLFSRLFLRRFGRVDIPFIEGGNSLELVFEHVATGKKPPEFVDQSSCLLLCLLELCFSLDEEKRNNLIAFCHGRIVLGRNPDGTSVDGVKPIHLMSWSPPQDWADRVLTKNLAGEGECQTLEKFAQPDIANGSTVAERLLEYVHESRKARPFDYPSDLPVSAVILACLKHQSPLPPELWRASIFGSVSPACATELGPSAPPHQNP